MSRTDPSGHWPARAVLAAVLAACSSLLAGSCQSSTGETLGGTLCTFQQTLECKTDAGCTGKSRCLPDLSGYGPCICRDGGVADASGGTLP